MSSYTSVLDNDYSKRKANGNRRCRITLFVLSLFLITVVIIILTLALTIFKPKDPYVSVTPIGLENFDFFQPNSSTAPLELLITIGNSNYGSFKYVNSTGYINYHDTIVGEVPLAPNIVPPRSKVNVSTYAGVMTQKLINDPKFLLDLGNGGFNCTSNATLHGKVIMLKIFKMKATVTLACDMSFKINIGTMNAESSCIAKLKL